MKDLILKYKDTSKYDYSCSETILRSSNDYFGLELDEKAFKMMAPFSGGMFERDLCGIMSAAVSVLGIIYTTGVAHTSPVLVEAVTLYKKRFKEILGSMNCGVLVETKRDPLVGCNNIIVEGGMLLADVVNIIDKKYHLKRGI